MNNDFDNIKNKLDFIAAEVMFLDHGDSFDGILKSLNELHETFKLLAMLENSPLIKEILKMLENSINESVAINELDADRFEEKIKQIRTIITDLIIKINQYCSIINKSETSAPQEDLIISKNKSKNNSKPSKKETQEIKTIEEPSAEKPVYDKEIMMDFFVETNEHLMLFENTLMTLEKEPANIGAINEAFRSIHSIKGAAGFLNLVDLNKLSHLMESLLSLFRDGITPRPESLHLLFDSLDMLKMLVNIVNSEFNDLPVTGFDKNKLTELFELLKNETESVKNLGASESISQSLIKSRVSVSDDIQSVTPSQKQQVDSIKVKIERIDQLVNMVGELVIIYNQVEQRGRQLSADTLLNNNLSQMKRAVSILQELALSMRMMPLSMTFQKLARLVRDFSKKTDKQIEVVVSGEGTELDRNVIEELQDPLVHLIRNSLDHGLEPADERTKAGKSPVGIIKLNAYHQSGMVVIELCDDGRGLNREKILEKAISKKMVSPEEAETLADEKIFELIFAPGFSTADKVSDISGRGVGMDVVKRNLEKLRGKIEIESSKGNGSTFKLKIPLTLAIIEGMVVRAGAEMFILPVISIMESLRPTKANITNITKTKQVVSVHDKLLPLVKLYEIFNLKPDKENADEALVMVIQSFEKEFCIQVDELIGQQQVVIKSLGKYFKELNGVSGAAILGDGRVGLILDIDQLSVMTV